MSQGFGAGMILGVARTSGDVNLPIRVGSTGIIDGSGNPVDDTIGPKPLYLLVGRTVDGMNLPVLCDADGKLNIDWNF